MSKYSLCDDYPEMERRIIMQGLDYVVSNGINSLVIGLSGGVDSTLTASLARNICDLAAIPLIGASLPTMFNKKVENDNARLAGESFCDEFTVMPINEEAKKLGIRLAEGKFNITDGVPSGEINAEELKRLKMRRGNIAARIRMIILYHLAHENHGVVLSTDNFTELMLGFWTLHGDVGDLGLIQSLWKTEVYGLTKYRFTEAMVAAEDMQAEALFQAQKAVPTDGLGITDSDLDQLGAASYDIVDRLLISYLKGEKVKMDHPVIQRHLKSAYKRENPYNLRREDIIV